MVVVVGGLDLDDGLVGGVKRTGRLIEQQHLYMYRYAHTKTVGLSNLWVKRVHLKTISMGTFQGCVANA